MTLHERLHGPQAAPEPAPRICRFPGCERSTAWPRDPEVVAAFCRAHTDELLIGPREPEPEWMPEWRRRGVVKDLTAWSPR